MKNTFKYKKENYKLNQRFKEYSVSEDISEQELINMEQEAIFSMNKR